MIFSVLKLQFLWQKWIKDPGLPMRHLDYTIPITENYLLNNFQRILAKKLTKFEVQMVESLDYTNKYSLELASKRKEAHIIWCSPNLRACLSKQFHKRKTLSKATIDPNIYKKLYQQLRSMKGNHCSSCCQHKICIYIYLCLDVSQNTCKLQDN